MGQPLLSAVQSPVTIFITELKATSHKDHFLDFVCVLP